MNTHLGHAALMTGQAQLAESSEAAAQQDFSHVPLDDTKRAYLTGIQIALAQAAGVRGDPALGLNQLQRIYPDIAQNFNQIILERYYRTAGNSSLQVDGSLRQSSLSKQQSQSWKDSALQ